jgi:hypothetical protein
MADASVGSSNTFLYIYTFLFIILLHPYICYGYSTIYGHDTILGQHVKDIPHRNSYCYEICLVVVASILGSDLSTMLT